MLEKVVVYVVGFPGTGKLTIARELSELTGAKVVDNHWINNPVFALLDNDRITPLPDEIWDQVAKIREAVLETIATLSPRDHSFVLTHAGQEGDADDRKIYGAIERTAARRGSVFVPVRLLCEESELIDRICSPERSERFKLMSTEEARDNARTKTVLKPNHPNTLTLDVTSSSPQDGARLILSHVLACKAAVTG